MAHNQNHDGSNPSLAFFIDTALTNNNGTRRSNKHMGNPNEIIVGKCYVIDLDTNALLEEFVKNRIAKCPRLKKTKVIRKALSLFLEQKTTDGTNSYDNYDIQEKDFDIRQQIKVQAVIQKVTMSDMVCQIIKRFIKDN